MLNKRYHTFKRVIRHISSILCYFGMGALAILTLLGMGDVFGRYLLNKPITGTFEISGLLLAGIVFFGLAYALSVDRFIKIDIFVTRMHNRTQAVLNFVTSFLGLVISSLFVWRSALFAFKSWVTDTSVNVIYIPVFPFQLFATLGFVVLCFELIIHMLDFFTVTGGRD